jgi:polysaccharide pyruvyl transferase WcaK-like protein
MRFGVIGYFGHGNAGDERILYCLRRYLQPHDLFVTRDLAHAMRCLGELNACDYVIFGGGGLVLRGFGRYAPLFESLKVPFACVGLGVEARAADNEALIRVLLERAKAIYVRDQGSARLLGDSPKVVCGPDLTFLYPFPVVRLSTAERCAVNLRPWAGWPGEYMGFAWRLFARLERMRGIGGRLLSRWRWSPDAIVELLRGHFRDLVPIPLHGDEGAQGDQRILQLYFDSVGPCFSSDAMEECRYAVMMRFHGVLFACQMGIPFVSLSYQPKSKSFCAENGMAEMSVGIRDTGGLRDAIEVMRTQAVHLREELLEVRSRAVSAAWDCMGSLLGPWSERPRR